MITRFARACLIPVVLVAISGLAAPAVQARQMVSLPAAYEAGSIIVSTRQRMLYLVNGDGTAIRYRVAVGKPGKQWFGTRVIDGKHIQPAWSPPGRGQARQAQPAGCDCGRRAE